jgi:hypothetical protein
MERYFPLAHVQFDMSQLPGGDHGKSDGHCKGACIELGQKYEDGHNTTAKIGFKIMA